MLNLLVTIITFISIESQSYFKIDTQSDNNLMLKVGIGQDIIMITNNTRKEMKKCKLMKKCKHAGSAISNYLFLFQRDKRCILQNRLLITGTVEA